MYLAPLLLIHRVPAWGKELWLCLQLAGGPQPRPAPPQCPSESSPRCQRGAAADGCSFLNNPTFFKSPALFPFCSLTCFWAGFHGTASPGCDSLTRLIGDDRGSLPSLSLLLESSPNTFWGGNGPFLSRGSQAETALPIPRERGAVPDITGEIISGLLWELPPIIQPCWDCPARPH